MMTKKINKIIVYYDDGTYEEIKTSLSDTQDQQHKKDVVPNPLSPDWQYYPPVYYQPGTVKHPWDPPFTVTCLASDNYKYTITTNSNGNVDISR